MKRILAFIMILVIALTLCACGGSGGKVCPSCGDRVGSLKTQKDWAGDSHTWCADCWDEYWDIIGGY